MTRKVKLRPWREFVPQAGDAFDAAAYAFYVKEMTYRWAFICQACYVQLDNEDGRAPIGSREFNLAGCSRGDRAPVVDEAKHQAFERRQAAKWAWRCKEVGEHVGPKTKTQKCPRRGRQR